MKTFLILFLTMIACGVHAQNNTIDSLQKILQTEKEDTNKVNTLNELSENFRFILNYKIALQYSKEALSVSEKINYKNGIGNSYTNIGYAYYKQNNYYESLKNLYKSLKPLSELDNKERVSEILVGIGHCYKYLNNDSEALKNYDASLEICNELKDTVRSLEPYINIGVIYFKEGKYPEAMQRYLIAKTIVEQKSEEIPREYLGICYEFIGEVYERQGEIARGKNHRGIALNKFSEAYKNYLSALNINLKVGRKEGVAASYSHLGKIYVKQKKLSEGYIYMEKGLKLSIAINDKDEMKDNYYNLSIIDSSQGKYKQAYEQYKMYILYRDSLINEESTKKVLQVQMQYEFDKKEDSTKAAQDKKDALSKAEIKNQKNIRNFSYAGTAALLGFAGIGFYRFRKRKKLQSQQEMLNERLRISRELHDDIGSTLGSISIYSEVAKNRAEKKESSDEVLSKIGTTSRELIDKMSDIVWSLNPNNESFEQLQNRMIAFAAMILAPRYIVYEFAQDDEIKKIQLTAEQRKNIFLIFKEAVYNIVKYAECKKVNIFLNVEHGIFKMMVQDDGKGFDMQTISAYNGNGIKNMRTRAEEMNGKLSVISGINKGTTVELDLKV